jgi:PadR family transcriptional regulator, regulatory protein PadR
MATPQTDLLQGALDLLILKALALQELHGMGVSRRIAQITEVAPSRFMGKQYRKSILPSY